MFRVVLLVALLAVAVAFAPSPAARSGSRTQLSMAGNADIKKAVMASLMGASLFLGQQQARAEIDYEGVKYLGGGDKVDLNNANIRAYVKIPGLYPGAASKIVNNGPYKSVSDVYNIPGLSGAEKDAIKKYEDKFVVLESKPEYVIDKINNGLYR